MREGDGKKRIAVIIAGGLFLIAMVIGVTIGVSKFSKPEKGSGGSDNISATRKAVDEICMPTDYKDICKSAIEKANLTTDNPRDLAKAAFNAAMQEINNVTEHSELLKELLHNPKTANATKVCKELFGYAIEDFRRSIDEIKEFDISNMDEILTNLKVWLSATITYEETCIDGFDKDTTTEAGLEVRKILTTMTRMSSNGLAIVTGMQQAELGEDPNSEGNDKKDNGHKTRRLMSWSDDFVMGHDGFVDDDLLDDIARDTQKKKMRRRLLGEDVVPRWLDVDDRRRELLANKKLDGLIPNITVALDGSGDYKKIADAIEVAPFKSKELFVIFVKEGVYREQLFIEGKQKNLVLIGAGPTKTIITGKLSTDDGTPTFKTCTVAARGDGFMAKDIAFENTAGPEKHQAVAIRVQSDKSIFHNCHFIGFQDTLYVHTYRQYFRDCQISGTVDFVFGNAAAFFQNCTFVMRKPMDNQQCIMLAQGRKERRQPTGIILHKSKIIASPEYFPFRFQMKAYLGRPWKEYSKSIIMESFIDDLVQPDGWMPWNTTDFGLNTSYFAEYRNEGPGSNTDRRVKWGGVKTILPSRAESFMPPGFYEGDEWIKASGVPYIAELTTDSSSYTAPPGVVDEDPDNEPPPSDVGDYDESDSKEKYKSSDAKKKKKSDSEDSSDDSSKESSGESSDESSKPKKSKHKSSKHSKAPSPSPGSLSFQPPGDLSIAQPPISWSSSVPSESPSSIEVALPLLEPSPSDVISAEAPLSGVAVPIETPSPTADVEISPSNIYPTDISEEPIPAIKAERTLTQVSMDEIGEIPSSSPSEISIESESPSPMYDVGNVEAQEDGLPISVSPSSVVNLEKVLMHEETGSESESPSSMFSLESAAMQQEEASTPTSEGPSSSTSSLEENLTEEEPPTSAPSESPSPLVNLEKTLLEANDYSENDAGVDDASDDNDDHDKFVTSNTVTVDKVLESLHLKTREDLSLDELMAQIENQAEEESPSPSSIAPSPENPTKKLRRALLEAPATGNNSAALAQLASSPESKTFMAQNGSMAAAPGANEIIQQLGSINTTSLQSPPAKNSDASGGFKIQFRLCFVALMMMIVLFV